MTSSQGEHPDIFQSSCGIVDVVWVFLLLLLLDIDLQYLNILCIEYVDGIPTHPDMYLSIFSSDIINKDRMDLGFLRGMGLIGRFNYLKKVVLRCVDEAGYVIPTSESAVGHCVSVIYVIVEM